MSKPLSNDLDKKYFSALLTGLVKLHYENDPTVTIVRLEEELFTQSQMTPPQRIAFINAVEKLLKQAAYENYENQALLAVLAQNELSDEQSDAFLQMWKKEQTKVKNSRTKWTFSASTWSRRLESVDWRIDLAAQGRNAATIEEPTAILQLKVKGVKSKEKDNKDTDTNKTGDEIITMEMDRATVANVIEQLKKIEALIQAQSS